MAFDEKESLLLDQWIVDGGNDANVANVANVAAWPTLSDTVLHGLAGDIVRAIEPHTEADPAAILISILTFFSNVIGATAYFTVEATRHHLRLFSAIAGETAKARKGTATDHALKLFKAVDSHWHGNRLVSGMSSGEGLISAVRDPVTREEDGEMIEIDPGEQDKRLMVFEGEFASALKVLSREGNTLSAIIRQAWDHGNIRTLTKNSPLKATGAHISILGHITIEELKRHLTATETANGFANRFLWVCAKRSKKLPRGGKLHTVDFSKPVFYLKQAIDKARRTGAMDMTEDAWKIWDANYDELSEGRTGMIGAITSRAEAQVRRIACLYALLDQEKNVDTKHLKAALALWGYCFKSAQYIFNETTGDAIADKILYALQNAKDGLTRTDISHGLFKKHVKKDRLDAAFQLLMTNGLVHAVIEEIGIRPTERWFAY
ncbi:MAG: DUF3987 domain-containing protein [Actinobacteria bacterium]|nr:DUF3987 domain-containing protein [Actinomycetota bacterium]